MRKPSSSWGWKPQLVRSDEENRLSPFVQSISTESAKEKEASATTNGFTALLTRGSVLEWTSFWMLVLAL